MPSEKTPLNCPLRLWRRRTPLRPARMERFLRKLGITAKRYMEWTGGQPLRSFQEANPTWTQRAWEVLILENLVALRQTPI